MPSRTLLCAALLASTNALQLTHRRARAVVSMSGAAAAAPPVPPVLGAATTETWLWRGHSIRFARSGAPSARPPLVLIHGFGSSADTWRSQFGALSADREARRRETRQASER